MNYSETLITLIIIKSCIVRFLAIIFYPLTHLKQFVFGLATVYFYNYFIHFDSARPVCEKIVAAASLCVKHNLTSWPELS
nr:TPA_asm: hypothetical protein [Planto tricladivirus]